MCRRPNESAMSNLSLTTDIAAVSIPVSRPPAARSRWQGTSDLTILMLECHQCHLKSTLAWWTAEALSPSFAHNTF